MEDNSVGDGLVMGVTLRTLLESRDLLNPPARRVDKEDKDDVNDNYDVSSAFLGPTLWDKTLSDLKLEYIDLDEFLATNNVAPPDVRGGNGNGGNLNNHPKSQMMNSHHMDQRPTPQPQPQHMPPKPQPLVHPPPHHHHQPPPSPPTTPCYDTPPLPKKHDKMGPSVINSPPKSPSSSSSSSGGGGGKKLDVMVDCKFSPNDLALATVPGQHFDPCNQALSEDDLKPQPMVKKSKKHFVPNDLKDDKYWARRRKNNMAAKRSREARRVKENQIVLRASFLEKENMALREEVQKLKEDNEMLRACLHKYNKH